MSKTVTSKVKRYRLTNLSGGENSITEDSAYFTVDPQASLGAGYSQIPFEFKQQENWRIINRGGLSKDYGFNLEKDTGVATVITGFCRYAPTPGANEFLFGRGTKVYKLASDVITSLTTATVSNAAYLDFEEADSLLFVSDGVGDPKVYNGTTFVAMTATLPTPSIGVRQCLYAQNRLWMFGSVNNRSLVYYSEALDTNSATSGYLTNFVNCNKNDGQQITGIERLFIPGELKPMILVSKNRSMGIIDGTGTASDPFTYKETSNKLGVQSFRQMVSIPDTQDVLFLTQKGVSSYNLISKDTNFIQKFLTEKIRDQFNALTLANLADALCWYDWKNDWVCFAVRDANVTGDSTYNNLIWVYDLAHQSWSKKTGFPITAAFVDTDGTVYHGDATGKIYKHVSSVFNYNGSAISATFKTPYMDFFQPSQFKRIIRSSMLLRGTGSYRVVVSTDLDYGVYTGTTHNLDITAGAYTWGGGNWTSDSTYKWGGPPLLEHKFFPGKIFKNISFTVTQPDANAPVDIIDWTIDVEYLDKI